MKLIAYSADSLAPIEDDVLPIGKGYKVMKLTKNDSRLIIGTDKGDMMVFDVTQN